VSDDRPWREATLSPQVVGELSEYPAVLTDRRWCRRRDRARLTQHRQPSPERRPVARLDVLPAASMPEVALDHPLIETGQLGPAARHPAEKPIDHVEASPRAKRHEPFLDETPRKKLDELSVMAVPEAPIRSAPAQVRTRIHRPVLRC
jgi:hypothetical protein